MGSEDRAGTVTLPEGTVLDGKYRIVGLVESTHTGTVYAAEKIPSGEVLAVHFLDMNLVKDEESVNRLLRDLEAIKNERHPNIAEIFDWNIPMPGEGGRRYVAMELIVGLPLSETLKKGGRIELIDALKIMLMVLDALATMHNAFVAHRNLSPQSIVLSVRPGEELQVKIVDFGLPAPLPAREILEGGKKKTERSQAWDYAAPEYYSGGHVVARSDIFACGMMLMRMLTGKLPERDPKRGTLKGEPERRVPGAGAPTPQSRDPVESREFPAAGSLNPVIPDELDNVISYALRKKPVERYAFASDMKEDIERITASIKQERSIELPTWQKPDEIIRYLDSIVDKMAPETIRGLDLPLGVEEPGEAPEEYLEKPKRSRLALYVAVGIAVLAVVALSYLVLPPLLRTAPGGNLAEGPKTDETLSPDAAVQESGSGAGVQGEGQTSEAGSGEVEKPVENPPVAVEEEVTETLTPEPGQALEPEPAPEDTGTGTFEHRPIHVVVMVEPKDAVVKIGNTVLKGSPPEADMVTRKWPVAIVAEADGYETFTKQIYLRKNRTFTLALNKLGVSAEGSGAKDKKKKKKKKKKKQSGWLFVD